MPTVSSVRRPRIVETAVDFDGELVTVTFDANRLTPAWIAAVQNEQADPMAAPRALASLIVGWDITDDAGGVWPPSPENLATFAAPFIGTMLEAMVAAATPTEAEGKASAVPLPTPLSTSTVQTQTSRNGQATSTSPLVSGSL